MQLRKLGHAKKKQKSIAKLKKEKLWSTKKADNAFSLFIRNRDNWICARCGNDFSERRKVLHNSHFWGRGHSSTRYDPKNCVALCYGCHYFHWEKEKQGDYQDFMLRWIGKKEYKKLEERKRKTVQRSDAIKEFMARFANNLLK